MSLRNLLQCIGIKYFTKNILAAKSKLNQIKVYGVKEKIKNTMYILPANKSNKLVYSVKGKRRAKVSVEK